MSRNFSAPKIYLTKIKVNLTITIVKGTRYLSSNYTKHL
jgi:hypothetical protein